MRAKIAVGFLKTTVTQIFSTTTEIHAITNILIFERKSGILNSAFHFTSLVLKA